MRTTLTIDDGIAQELKDIAYKSGKPFKQVVNETLRNGLNADGVRDTRKPYKVRPVSMGTVAPGYNLDKALQLADALEDDELAAKLERRK